MGDSPFFLLFFLTIFKKKQLERNVGHFFWFGLRVLTRFLEHKLGAAVAARKFLGGLDFEMDWTGLWMSECHPPLELSVGLIQIKMGQFLCPLTVAAIPLGTAAIVRSFTDGSWGVFFCWARTMAREP